MAVSPMSKFGLLLAMHVLGTSMAIDVDATCKIGSHCANDTPQQADPLTVVLAQLAAIKTNAEEDVNALLQGRQAQVLTEPNSRVRAVDGRRYVKDFRDQTEATTPPRIQKLDEMEAAVMGVKELIGNGATPGLVALIDSMIKIIEVDLKDKVKNDQTLTQSKVDSRITSLTERTESAVEEKAEADRFDNSYVQCVTEEQELLEAHETCKLEEALLTAEFPTTAYCGNPDFDIAYHDPPQFPKTLTVDFSKGLTHVEGELDAYLAPLQAYIAETKLQAAKDQETWDAADQSCKAKTKELDDKKKECIARLDAWTTQNAKCAIAKHAREKNICEFGHKYQAKCAAKTDYDDLHEEITGKGTERSQPDRMHEWRQFTKLTCTLEAFKVVSEEGAAITGLTTGAVETCTQTDDQAEAQFAADVGVIDHKTTTYDLLTSEANFTCDETEEIMFGSGIVWTLPEAPAEFVRTFERIDAQQCDATSYTNGCKGWTGLTEAQCARKCEVGDIELAEPPRQSGDTRDTASCPAGACVAAAFYPENGECHLYSTCDSMTSFTGAVTLKVEWKTKSTDYSTTGPGYKYAIESDDNNPPFAFCLGKGDHETAPTCGLNFDCGGGSRTPEDTKCYMNAGCTAAECCHKTAACGDHVLDVNEECDDGNVTPKDGCSAACTNEATCEVPVIDAGLEFWAADDCSTDTVFEGTDCQITATGGYTCTSPGVCGEDGSFEAQGECEAIICTTNQKVVNHECVVCPAGKTSSGDHDASGSDTSCDATYCDANEKVVNNICTACPAGKTSSGKHDASGIDTLCDATMCGDNEKVVDHTCKVCAPGKTSNGPHDASKGNTVCTATICSGPNAKVVGHVCQTCAAGKTSVGDLDASGSDTTCDKILCGPDQKVVSNACVACPPGKTSTGSHDASLGNTFCDAEKCGENEKVVSHKCVACPAGKISSGEHDASGGDTSCEGCAQWDVRLMDVSGTTGTPEVYIDGDFRPLCGHYFWDNQIGAKIICKQLGFASGTQSRGGRYTKNAVFVKRCDYVGPTLESCTAAGWAKSGTMGVTSGGYTCATTQNVKIRVGCSGTHQTPSFSSCQAANGWNVILRYGSDSYSPTSSAVGNVMTAGGFAKLSDAAINAISDGSGYHYYKLTSGTDSTVIYVRTQKSFSDTSRAFGWTNDYDVCNTADFGSCSWRAVNGGRFDTAGVYGNNCNRWFTDYSTTIHCYSKGQSGRRCFSNGAPCGHAMRTNVVMYKFGVR